MYWKPMSEKEVFLVSQIVERRLKCAGSKQGKVYSSQEVLARPACKIGLAGSLDSPSTFSSRDFKSAAIIWKIICKIIGDSNFLYQIEHDGPMGKCFFDDNNQNEMISFLLRFPSISFLSHDFTEGCWVNFPEKSMWVFGPKLVAFVKKSNLSVI